MVEIQPEFVEALEQLTPLARVDPVRALVTRDPLRALVTPEAERLERIHHLRGREDTGEVAELLIDIDADAWARADAIAALVVSDRPAAEP